MNRLKKINRDNPIHKDNLNSGTYLKLMEVLAKYLKVDQDVLDPTLARYVGQHFNEDTIVSISRVIAGTRHYLEKGRPVPDVSVPLGEEWSLLWVWDIKESPKYNSAWLVTFEVMAGAMVEKQISRYMSTKAVQWLGRQVGFPKYEIVYPLDLFGTSMKASIIYEGGAYGFGEFEAGNAEMKHNRGIYRARHGRCIHGRIGVPCCAACDWPVENCKQACRRVNGTKN